MGCNTSKEAVAPVGDASAEQEAKSTDTKQQKEQAEQGDNVEDIDPSDPDAQRAATKIQAVFRGHQTRKSMKSGDNQEEAVDLDQFDPNDKELCHAATKIQASFRGHMARKVAPPGKPEDDLSKELQKLDAKAEEEELDIDLSDPDLHKAATKIQASFRGHKVRKDVDDGKEVTAASQ